MQGSIELYRYDKNRYQKQSILVLRGEVNVRTDTKSFDFDSVTIDVTPENAPTDCDGDRCRQARFEIIAPKLSLIWYPAVEIVGFLEELCVTEEIQKHPGGEPRYVPEPDPEWEPWFVMAQVIPKEL